MRRICSTLDVVPSANDRRWQKRKEKEKKEEGENGRRKKRTKEKKEEKKKGARSLDPPSRPEICLSSSLKTQATYTGWPAACIKLCEWEKRRETKKDGIHGQLTLPISAAHAARQQRPLFGRRGPRKQNKNKNENTNKNRTTLVSATTSFAANNGAILDSAVAPCHAIVVRLLPLYRPSPMPLQSLYAHYAPATHALNSSLATL